MELSRRGIPLKMKSLRSFYTPGIISLIGLPVLCLLLLHCTPKPVSPAPKPIKLFLPKDQPDPPNIIGFSKYTFLNSLKKKKTLEIDLTEDVDSNAIFIMKRKRVLISRKIEELQFIHDTTIVIKVNFGETNTFGDFMWVLMQARTYGLKRYAYFDNCFYLLGSPRPAPDTPGLEIKPLYM